MLEAIVSMLALERGRYFVQEFDHHKEFGDQDLVNVVSFIMDWRLSEKQIELYFRFSAGFLEFLVYFLAPARKIVFEKEIQKCRICCIYCSKNMSSCHCV
jgi:hypothetical protein